MNGTFARQRSAIGPAFFGAVVFHAVAALALSFARDENHVVERAPAALASAEVNVDVDDRDGPRPSVAPPSAAEHVSPRTHVPSRAARSMPNVAEPRAHVEGESKATETTNAVDTRANPAPLMLTDRVFSRQSPTGLATSTGARGKGGMLGAKGTGGGASGEGTSGAHGAQNQASYVRHARVECDEDAVQGLFPASARAAGVAEAVVTLEVGVDELGKITSARVSRDPGHGFAQAARKALYDFCRIRPALDRHGKPAPELLPAFRVRFLQD